ncbi:MAG: hypothetical protein ACMUJK_09735 [Rhodobacterales bacterium]
MNHILWVRGAVKDDDKGVGPPDWSDKIDWKMKDTIFLETDHPANWPMLPVVGVMVNEILIIVKMLDLRKRFVTEHFEQVILCARNEPDNRRIRQQRFAKDRWKPPRQSVRNSRG